MGRMIQAGALARAQVDIFQPGGLRAQGLAFSSLTAVVFADNVVMPWAWADGTGVADGSIAAGTLYFNEIFGSPGFYALRFFPDRPGFWRIVMSVPAFSSELVQDYDVLPASSAMFSPASPGGLTPSFLG